MYQLKNYLLSMQSHWMINHTTYKAVQDTLPDIVKFKGQQGMEDMGKTPIHKVIKKIHPEIYRVPLFPSHDQTPGHVHAIQSLVFGATDPHLCWPQMVFLFSCVLFLELT